MSEVNQLDLFDVKEREKEIASIDRLFQDIKQYRKCSEFKKKLDFYSAFPYIGVYNAELVAQQRPGARFVLTAKKWAEKYQRKIKPNARPLIILVPFYPVEFLFDISDTKPMGKYQKSQDDRVIEDIIERYKIESSRNAWYYLDRIRENLTKNGIHFTGHYVVGSEKHAEIRADRSEKLYVPVYKDFIVDSNNYFTISVNAESDAEAFAAICHELGHLFCHHLLHTWCKERFFNNEEEEKVVKEFEAEVVSYLVCSRLGIHTNSMKYLAEYLHVKDEIPEISVERVFHAVDVIQRMASEYMDITECMLYKHDVEFKAAVDKEKKRRKEEREKAKASQPSR
jgi:hypothetical protein